MKKIELKPLTQPIQRILCTTAQAFGIHWPQATRPEYLDLKSEFKDPVKFSLAN
jgi:hypothetical protein